MADEEETFDIDIYGDEGQGQEQEQQVSAQTEDDENLFDDEHNAQYGFDGVAEAPSNDVPLHKNSRSDEAIALDDNGEPAAQKAPSGGVTAESKPPAQQGTKRKAPSEEDEATSTPPPSSSRSVEPGAMPALKLTELHWWTTEDDLRAFCSRAGVEDQLRDLSFGEHKINGKSRGEAYLEFSSAQAASTVKKAIEAKEPTKDGGEKRVTPFHVSFSSLGNPYKGRDSGAAGKKDAANGVGAQARNGSAYNNFGNRGGGGGGGGFSNRGNFGRGGGGFANNRGGGGGFQGQQGWGMNNNMFGNMGRGGMGQMMGRGGFGGGMNPMMGMGMGMGNMGNMMGMGGRGGMMGGFGNMGRGGGGMMGMQGGGGGGGGFGMGMMGQNQGQGYGQNQGQANKRMREG